MFDLLDHSDLDFVIELADSARDFDYYIRRRICQWPRSVKLPLANALASRRGYCN